MHMAETKEVNTTSTHLTNQGELNQKEKYGGFNFGAAFFGWLVANSVTVLLISLLTALGGAVALTVANTTDSQEIVNNASTIGIGSAIALLIALCVAYFAGGYVAGRMSRFDGVKQGFGVWLMALIITIFLALAGTTLGSSFNLLQQLNVPSIPVDGQSFTTVGIVTALLALILTALAAIAGGKKGQQYHHKVDKAAYVSYDKSDDRAAM